MIHGYKCFDEGLVNRYGEKFEIGKVYRIPGDIKFHKNGFHMCKNLEDTLRYFDAVNNKVDIASVTGYGEVNEYEDEYNGFYDMYATEYLVINHVLSRDEIMDYAFNLPPYRIKRFVSLFGFTNEELEILKNNYAKENGVIQTILYYQDERQEIKTKIKK